MGAARERPPSVWAVIGEAALYQQVGGPEVMREQVDHLLTLSARPHVTLQVLPFSAGAHPGVDGAFTVLSFPPQDEQDVILVDAMTSNLYLESEQQTSRYVLAFDHIRASALGIPETDERLRRMLQTYTGTPD
ncbi:DUF5753 domain-containing protein [Streptomyces sp. ACA25]|uniref:DUF5753 domain-containing protein n=1 Tax=Streptomyces sp. ACA25 TaxID=3022596 RepID=UPI002307AEA6|nr:DUF5753 domain-containing protein [Streptomyces sp. ACA25]MDB1090181.1 DUF5753 domain-containing protein [Streptomyces sp. ACA25]